jgi:hypothetical protein
MLKLVFNQADIYVGKFPEGSFYIPLLLDGRARENPQVTILSNYGSDIERSILLLASPDSEVALEGSALEDFTILGAHYLSKEAERSMYWRKEEILTTFLTEVIKKDENGSPNFTHFIENFEEYIPRISKPILFLAWYIEYIKYVLARARGEVYKTRMGFRMDATCSGIQIISMILGDLELARQSNVIPQTNQGNSSHEKEGIIPLGDWYKLNSELLRKMIVAERSTLISLMKKLLPSEIQPAIGNIFYEKLDSYFSRKTVKYITMCVSYGLTFIGRVRALRRDILAEFFDDINIIMVNYLRTEIQGACRTTYPDEEEEQHLKRVEKILKEFFNRRTFLKDRLKTKWKIQRSTDRKADTQRKNNKKAYFETVNQRYLEILIDFGRDCSWASEQIETYFQNQKLINKKKNKGKGRYLEYNLVPLLKEMENGIFNQTKTKITITSYNTLKSTLEKEREERRVEKVINEEREYKNGLWAYKKELKRIKMENKEKPKKERIYATIDYELTHIFDSKGLNMKSGKEIDLIIDANKSGNFEKPKGVRNFGSRSYTG